MILIASPRHPLAARARIEVKDVGSEPFVVHDLCSSTEQKNLRLFEAHGMHCNIAAELWSFENVKHFVQQDIGPAIVPHVTILQELAAGTLVGIPVKELDISRQTFMVFRDHSYVSDSAQRFIDVVMQFNWAGWLPQPTETRGRRSLLRAVRNTRLKTGA